MYPPLLKTILGPGDHLHFCGCAGLFFRQACLISGYVWSSEWIFGKSFNISPIVHLSGLSVFLLLTLVTTGRHSTAGIKLLRANPQACSFLTEYFFVSMHSYSWMTGAMKGNATTTITFTLWICTIMENLEFFPIQIVLRIYLKSFSIIKQVKANLLYWEVKTQSCSVTSPGIETALHVKTSQSQLSAASGNRDPGIHEFHQHICPKKPLVDNSLKLNHMTYFNILLPSTTNKPQLFSF